ncbi:MAG: adenosylhomocysteinase [Oscillospiraceae bacterium]|jgi:adenosylhomocysteinase|nr:adenosylhomocysteinase [Oscillospiraceae bacterium]
MSRIKDPTLRASGACKIDWVRAHMPLLNSIEDEFRQTKPLAGKRIALSVHMEAKTAYLCLVLQTGGAEVWATGSNPLSTQDDVAAALADSGVEVFAVYGCSAEEYAADIRSVLQPGPHIIIDDGGDLVSMIHTELPELLPNVLGGCEETTTGILRLRQMENEGQLAFPMVLVNDADCKHMFDNRYGTGQSVIEAICRTTNLILAGKTVVIAGYGWCGKGAAMRAKGLGANVTITEVDPIKALEAYMDGFTVLPMDAAAAVGEVFITVTGCNDVITAEHFRRMKDGAILANAGHFNVEVNVSDLENLAARSFEARKNIAGYVLPGGKTLYLLGEGRLVNLACGDGHPAEIMDMSFALQAESARYIASGFGGTPPAAKLLPVPRAIDLAVALRKLESLGLSIDTLTAEQCAYLGYDVPANTKDAYPNLNTEVVYT